MDANEILDAVSLAVAELRKEQAATIEALRADVLRALETRPTEATVTMVLETVAGKVDVVAQRLEQTSEAIALRAAAAFDLAQAAQDAAAHVRDDLLEGFILSRDRDDALQAELAEALSSAPKPVVEGDVVSALLEALTPVHEALEAHTRRLDAHEDRVTEDRLREALAPMIETLAKHEDGIVTEDRLRKVLDPIQESLIGLDTAIEVLHASTEENIAEAVIPLRRTLEEIQNDVEARVTPDQLSTALSPVTGALATVADRLETKATAVEFQEFVTAIKKDRDVLAEAVNTKVDAEYATVALTQLEEVSDAHSRMLSEITDHALAFKEALEERVTVDQLAQAVEGVVTSVSTRLLERYQKIEPWAQGGAGYQPFALVQHRGAIWQATTRTHDEPTTDSSRWALLTDAIASLTFERRTPGYVTLVTRYVSGGPETTLDVREPVPVFRGVYNSEATYTTWDSVAKDSHIFLCLTNAPTGGPGEVLGEWQVTSGPRGRKGKDAPEADERAIASRVMHEVIPQLQQVVDSLQS